MTFTRVYTLLFLILCLFGCSENKTEIENGSISKKKPNILLLIVDDLRPELGCYGNKNILSPNIDKLANEGILFNNAYTQQPICMASRASFFTGYRPDYADLHRGGSVKKQIPEAITVNKHFEKQGYSTWATGKVYHYGEDNVEQFGSQYVSANVLGRYLTSVAIAQVKEYAIGYDELRPNDAGSKGKGPAYEAADVPDSAYIDGALTNLAVSQIEEFGKNKKPFFMAIGFRKPHLPFNAPKKYWDKYNVEEMELADNPFLPNGANEYTKYNFNELRNYYGIPKDNNVLPDDLSQKLIHGYYACISYIDAQVGKVLDELERQNLRENTIVLLMGDHGWKLGEHGMWAKHTPFELDCRVPLIISAPELKNRGIKTDAMCELIDIYPTLCELSDLNIPKHVEGNSMLPFLKNPTNKWKEAVFTQTTKHARAKQEPEKVTTGYSVKTKRYRYTEWTLHQNREVLAIELYDHQKDPKENENIANLPGNELLVSELSKLLQNGQGWRNVQPL